MNNRTEGRTGPAHAESQGRSPRADRGRPRGHRRERHRVIAVAAAIGVGVLGLAGCGSSAGGGGHSSQVNASESLSVTSQRLIAKYTGAKVGRADKSLAPVTWGYVNQQGGALTFPQYTTQMRALVATINDQLGGIGGHPLKLDSCFVVSSDEDGQTCAQQFVSNKSISAIMQFPLVNGDAAFHRIIDSSGIPVFGPLANTPQDATAANEFFASGSNFSTVPIMTGYTITKLHAKSVAIIGVEGDGISQLVTGALTNSFQAAGVQAKLANISPTSTDVTAPLVAAGVKSADAILATVSTTSQCANVYKTLKSLGVNSPVVAIGQCATQDVKNALGDYPHWTFIDGYPNALASPLNAREAAEVAVAKDLIKATGGTTGQLVDAEATTQAFVTALTVVNRAGAAKATAASTVKAALAFHGPLFLGPDKVGWGTVPGLRAIPTLAQRLYIYDADGKWVDAGHGWFSGIPSPPPR